MALSEKDIEELVESLVHGYEEQYVAELTETIVQEFADGFTYSAETDLLTLSKKFPDKANVLLLKYRDKISKQVQDEITATLSAANSADMAALAAIYKTVDNARKTRANIGAEELTRQTAKGVADIIKRQNVALSASYQAAWYNVTAETVATVNQGLKSREKALADGVVKLMNTGIQVIPYQKNGKSTITNHVDVALRRHITTQVSQAGGRMSLDAMDLYNHDLVITDAHYGARESHAYWQGLPCCRSGQKTIDGETYPDMVSLTEYGSVTGLKGANCRHMIFPYFPGITPLPDREFKAQQEKFGMTSDEYYRATQRQRELERRIRKTKREVAGLEQAGIGFENPTYVNKRLLLGKQQSTLKSFCKENNLARLYEREKAYGVVKQPRALRVPRKPITGALTDKNDPDGSKRYAHAVSYYEQIRNRNRNMVVARIAERSGLSKSEAERAFNHLFIEEHDLIDGRHRFTPDYDMAQSIQRLLSSKEMHYHDKLLFPHENLESVYMNRGFDQQRAHELANYDYNYEKALNDWIEKDQ